MIAVVTGVSGAGKTTVGKALAARLGWQFADADDFHSEANKRKMEAGIPLNNKDRAPWLAGMRAQIDAWLESESNAVLACSALKSAYRVRLGGHCAKVRFVFLEITLEEAVRRLSRRQGHFMKANMAQSQFEALERPTAEEAMIIDGSGSPDSVSASIAEKLAK